MSHFSVLVIGPDHEAQLAPFHEFECTGTDDQYVQDIDKTAEAREEFASRTEDRLQAPDGTLHSFFDDRGEWRPEFSQADPDGFGSWRRKRFVPDDYSVVKVPVAQVMSLAKFAEDWYGWKVVPNGKQPDTSDEHKYGYILTDAAGNVVKCIDRTNPNAQWDWYQVGGRWSGFLKLKPGAKGEIGEPGVMGSNFARGDDRADRALKRDVDFDGMREQAGEKAGALWDKAKAIRGDLTWEPWASVRARMDIEAARSFYHAQPAVVALVHGDRDAFGWDLDDTLSGPREAFIQAARDRAGCTFAILYKGEWTERGSMGWFGCVSGEMDEGKWHRMFASLIDGLPGDTMLTVVDCHI